MHRKVKIIATVGPASMDEGIVKAMVENGMDAMRINMSHGDYEEHERKIRTWRRISEGPVIVDLTGPSIRTDLKDPITVSPGDKIVIGEDIYLSKEISHYVVPGDRILIDDGKVELEVENVRENKIETVVLVGGEIRNRKSVNIPGADIELDVPTEKDRRDILWAIEHDVDIFFMSFVTRAEEVLAVKEFLKENGSDAWVFAKIESKKGVENIREIAEVADGIVVARGDLGVEIPLEEVPLVQKRIVKMCRALGVPVVVATQMLASMAENPYPTRAEVSDIANAVMDGVSALMLTNETAAGKYPVKAVETLSKIILAAQMGVEKIEEVEYRDDADAVASAAYHLAEKMRASAIITPTSTGRTPKRIGRFAPDTRIVAISDRPEIVRRTKILFGTESYLVEEPLSYETLVKMIQRLRMEKKLQKGDAIIDVNVSRNGRAHTIRVTRA